MSARPVPPELLPWLASTLEFPASSPLPKLSVVAGDASHRRYFRLEIGGASHIVVDSPPESENNEAFLQVCQLLAAAGVRVPEIRATNLSRGYLLLEDFGDNLLLPNLSSATVDRHYQHALAVLGKLSDIDIGSAGLATYSRGLLLEELSRFPEWFVSGLLKREWTDRDQEIFHPLAELLITSAQEQPQVVVHRDFHSRNLMLLEDGGLGVIDFQDAVIGPITYDLVSLLRDCYIRWPAERVDHWALAHRSVLVSSAGMAPSGDSDFLRWLDLMGLQRHIKVLGVFARLYLRDGKPAYLRDLPLVLWYVRHILEKYRHHEPAIAAFLGWIETTLMPVIHRQNWNRQL